MKERAHSATPPAVGGGMAVPSLVCWPKPRLLPGRHFPLDAPGPTEDRDRERGCSRERSVITEETHTCSEHYGQGGRKSGKWGVAQGAGVVRSEERAGPPRWEERAKETREGAERGIFDCSMPVFFFFFKSTCKT